MAQSMLAQSTLRAVLVAGVVTFGASTALAQFGFIFGDPPPRPPSEVPGGNVGPGGRGGDAAAAAPVSTAAAADAAELSAAARRRPADAARCWIRTCRAAVRRRKVRPPRRRRRPCHRRPTTRSSDRRRSASCIRPRISPASTRSPAASSISRWTSARPCSSARCSSPRAPATRVRPTEAANTDAFVEVDEVTLQGEVKRIFTGWMFASSPGLHAVEHPIYDLWLTDCKGGTQVVAAEARTPEPTPAAQPQQKAQPKQKQIQQQPQAAAARSRCRRRRAIRRSGNSAASCASASRAGLRRACRAPRSRLRPTAPLPGACDIAGAAPRSRRTS